MKKGDYHSLLSETLDDADDVVTLAIAAVVTTPECWSPDIRSEGENADKVTWSQEPAVHDPSQPLLV